jgi:Ca2+-binding EF-hand superfamily protein
MMRSQTTMLLLGALLLVSRAQAQAELAPSEVPSNLAPPADSDAAAIEAFARMDSDRDGQLSLEEFEAGIARPFGSQTGGVVYQKLASRFRVLDADGDSFLDAGEYAGLAQRWQGHGDAPPPLAQADRNHDGKVDFREFAFVHSPSDEDSHAEGGELRSAEDTAPVPPEDSSTAPASAPRRAPVRTRPASFLRRAG